MQKLFVTYNRLISATELDFFRYLHDKIDWNSRLIVIKGARGVGKTTMLLQHIKKTFADVSKALYVSADHISFSSITLLELAEYFYTHGGTHLFVDEIHKYKGWEQEVKNIYDSYPQLHVVLTGSSMLRIEATLVADLSRRCRVYTLHGLSFREYLQLEGVLTLPRYSLEQVLQSHIQIASDITSKAKILNHFERYIRIGYYPFYREDEDGFNDRLMQVIELIIESEIPSVGKVEYDSVYKLKRLLGVLASTVPYSLNISSLCTTLGVSRNNVTKMIDLMDKAALIRRLYDEMKSVGALAKPEKVLFNNTNILYALSSEVNSGTMRETYLASQVSVEHKLNMPENGDLLIDDKITFEVGGKNKKYKQIADKEDSFVVADDIEIGFGNKIPLWMFGLIY